MTRRLNLITASSVQTAFAGCVAPWVPGTQWTEAKGWSLRMGSAVHRALEMHLLGHKFDLPQIRDVYGLTDRQVEIVDASFCHLERYLREQFAHKLPDMKPEVKFAISTDLTYAKELKPSGERDYSEAEPFALLACTVDAVRFDGKTAHIFELKTGGGWQPRPLAHPQMLVQGLCVARAYGLSTVTATMLKATEKECVGITEQFDVFDLLSVEGMLQDVIEASTEPKPGDHCGRCRVANCEVRQEKKPRAA